MKVASLILNSFLFDNRVLKENLSLSKAGYQPVVFALHEDDLKERETVQGVEVVRIKLNSKNWSKSRFVQAFKYLEFLFRAFNHCRKFDIIHCNDIGMLPVGVFIKFFGKRGIKVIYDAHEYQTALPYISKTESKLRAIAEKVLLRFADAMITVSNEIAEEYVKNYGIKKPALVLNCPPYREPRKTNTFRQLFNIAADTPVFLYQGALVPSRGIEQILEAAEKASGGFAMVFMGYGILEGQIKEVASRNKKVFLQPAVSGNELLEYTSSADYGFVILSNEHLNHNFALTNKFFEYIMGGVVPIGNSSYSATKVMEEFKIGVNISNGKSVDEIKDLLEGKGLPGLEGQQANLALAAKEFNWEKQEEVLLRVYANMFGE